MIDFYGFIGYGQVFIDVISQYWGDCLLEDLQKGWVVVQKQYLFFNGDKVCVLGVSYGGFMVNWIVGNWNELWKCLVNYDGVFDQCMMGYVIEELWFIEWEQGGMLYQKVVNYEKFNLVNYVVEWKKLILVIYGQFDFCILVEQGLVVFIVVQCQGIEFKFLYFLDENYWVFKLQNSVQWYDIVNGWLKQYIGQ